MYRPSWITKSQLEVAYEKGLKLLNAFCFATDGEQSWTEIEIDGNFLTSNAFKKQSKMMLCVMSTQHIQPRAENIEKQMSVKRLDSAQEKEVLND